MTQPLKVSFVRAASAAAFVVSVGVIGVLATRHAPSARAVVKQTLQDTPAAAPFFAFHGNGFSVGKGALVSDVAPRQDQDPERSLAVLAPLAANGEFSVGTKPGVLATIRLLGAASRPAELEHGAVTYPSAYPAVDVVAVRDPDRFELAYVLREARASLNVALSFGHLAEAAIEENADGSLTIRGESGRARLHIDPAVAVDAKGNERSGKYTIDGDTVRIALDTSALTPPIVLDPAVYIPFWTLIADGRQPGSATYLPRRNSRETHVAFNPKSGHPWLIRPVRSQQPEDRAISFGVLDFMWNTFPLVSQLSRVSGSAGPTFSPTQLVDWQRTYNAESETWEWSGSRWTLLPQSGLAGLIDPSLGYAPGTGNMVVFGGMSPDFSCNNPSFSTQDFTFCSVATAGVEDGTSVFENDGSKWTRKGLSGAPRPRVRPSSSAFGSDMLVFGGRAIALDHNHVDYAGPPFPDSLSDGFLNDTWLYDGAKWKAVPSANAPPAQEAAQIVYDARRKRSVLVGGNTVDRAELVETPVLGLDPFSLWEFDGSDWLQRFEPGDARLPVSFQQRRGVAALWHPVRQTTILFGGFVDLLDSCPYSGTALAQKRLAAATDNVLSQQLMTQGCTPGYAHDAWEWDGANLKQLTQAAFCNTDTVRIPVGFEGINAGLVKLPVYCQVTAPLPGPGTLGTNDLSGSVSSHLWPFRYDASGNHFPLRSALERAYAPPAALAPTRKTPGSSLAPLAATSTPTFASPVFGATAIPQLTFDPSSGRILIFTGGDARVFDTDLQSWVERTPSSSPFDAGENDFFAATWDSGRQRAVLFDPRTGLTWEHADGGAWTKPSIVGGPGLWSVSPTIRSFRDLDEAGLLSLPKMTYDRSRARTIMIYGNSLWEYDGASWAPKALPPSLTNCTAATMATFDGIRKRTIVVGCTVPAQTWEWDGSAWFGPFASPFTVAVHRGYDNSNPTIPADPRFNWMGTLQLPWAHSNALFEASTLGGVGTFDASRLTVWNGSKWTPGPALPQEFRSDAAQSVLFPSNGSTLDYGVPYAPLAINDYNYVPNNFSLPVVEDFNGHRLLAFRDGVRGLRELPFGFDSSTRFWQETLVGKADPVPVGPFDTGPPPFRPRVHPHPFELLSPEHIVMMARSDPALKTDWQGNPKKDGLFLSVDETVTNLYWPFRLLPDPTTQRIRILTHRGVFWEFGSEVAHKQGDACLSANDCADTDNCQQGVCCQTSCTSPCATCNGKHPGVCEPLPAGNACSGGSSCADSIVTSVGQCDGVNTSCPTGSGSHACPGGFVCANNTSCQTHCSSSRDCANGSDVCSPDGTACITNPRFTSTCENGILSRLDGSSTGPCPGGFGCADGSICKTSCISRLDCAGAGNDCAAGGGSCIPDTVTVAAKALGITPSTWVPSVRRTPQQVADLLKDAGFEVDDAGRVLFDNVAMSGLTPAYNPNLKNPQVGFRACLERLRTCDLATGQLDACVAATPRCVTTQPWQDDPGGFDCCPSACLLEYLSDRKTSDASSAILSMSDGTCYPGLQAYLQGKDAP